MFRRYFFLTFALLILTAFYIPLRLKVPYPKPLGPTLHNHLRAQYAHELAQSKADVVLVGDSILVRGVDSNLLEQLLRVRTISLGIEGIESAGWYLMTKNFVVTAPHKPRLLVITFRDTILTAPGFRVNGKYFALLDELSTPKDTLFLQRSYIQQMSPAEQLVDQYLPLYGSRLSLRARFDSIVRYTLPAIFGCDRPCNDQANTDVFQENKMDQNLLVDSIDSAESYLYTPNMFNFDKQVDQSYLPEIIRLAHENNIQLILVRSKRWNGNSVAPESSALIEYIEKLKVYADKNNVILLDFSHDERLTRDLYYDNLHTTKAGATVFTNILGEALLPILNK
jgi:hypothetical protein